MRRLFLSLFISLLWLVHGGIAGRDTYRIKNLRKTGYSVRAYPIKLPLSLHKWVTSGREKISRRDAGRSPAEIAGCSSKWGEEGSSPARLGICIEL